MSLEIQLRNLATRISTECKTLRTLANGNAKDLSALTTTAKGNLLLAVNELHGLLTELSGRAVSINDTTAGTASTFSSAKIVSLISAEVAKLVGSAPEALDTFAEVAAELAKDKSGMEALSAAIGNRVRFDAPQTLTAQQRLQVLGNVGAAAVAHTHDIANVTGLQEVLTLLRTDVDAKVASTAIGNPEVDLVAVFEAGLK